MKKQNRVNLSSGSPWEDIVGYSRAVKVGNIIEVTGTVADHEGTLIGENDVYLQTKFTLQKIEKSIIALGGTLDRVVRTRMFVTNIDEWQAIGKAHHEFFKDIKPCTSMIEVSRLISPDYLIEIEATAILAH